MYRSSLAAVALILLPFAAAAEPAGMIKVMKGSVQIERAGATLPAAVGSAVEQGDRVVTGGDGAVGITFRDHSQLSAGPGSTLEISRFVFDTTTHEGAFDAKLERGTLNAISGDISRQTPEAMKVHTPTAILGVRGTEFYVKVGDAR